MAMAGPTMSPSDAYQIAGNRFGAASKYLNLKRVFDDAVCQREWKMEEEAISNRQKEKEAETKFGRDKELKMMDIEGDSATKFITVASAQAKAAIEAEGLTADDPQYGVRFQQYFNHFYNSYLGKNKETGSPEDIESYVSGGYAPPPTTQNAGSFASGLGRIARGAFNIASNIPSPVNPYYMLSGGPGRTMDALKRVSGGFSNETNGTPSRAKTIKVKTPDGKVWDIAPDKWNEAKKRGAKRI